MLLFDPPEQVNVGARPEMTCHSLSVNMIRFRLIDCAADLPAKEGGGIWRTAIHGPAAHRVDRSWSPSFPPLLYASCIANERLSRDTNIPGHW